MLKIRFKKQVSRHEDDFLIHNSFIFYKLKLPKVEIQICKKHLENLFQF